MKVKDIKLKIYSKTPTYNGSGYRIRYGLTNDTVEIQSSQKTLIDIPKMGFTCKGTEIENFYVWDNSIKGFKTFPKWSGEKLTDKTYNEFKEFIKKLSPKIDLYLWGDFSLPTFKLFISL